MRIISGFLKARRFTVPKNFPSRPTTNFAKEGLFNILGNRIDLFDLKILDLCAGTGNISFEFISREAGEITAVDSHPNCLRYIQKNAIDLGIKELVTTVKEDIIKFVQRTDQKFDLIFTDPPYGYPHYEELIRIIFERELLTEDGLLIVEHSRDTKLEHLPQFEFCRTFGNVYFSFFKVQV